MLQSERYFANLLVAHIGDATKQSAPQRGAFSKLQECCNSTTVARSNPVAGARQSNGANFAISWRLVGGRIQRQVRRASLPGINWGKAVSERIMRTVLIAA